MTVPFVTTKFYIPPVRPGLVSRPRLIERLNAGLWRNDSFARRLTLISSPPGFGKTELLGEWTNGVEWPVAWVSLDKDDNNPTRFWAAFITALQTIQADIGKTALAVLHSSPPLPIKSILTTLLNQIAEGPNALTVILDDYHVIESQAIHDSLAFVLDHMPPKLHLILSTRVEPTLPLGRLRSQRRLTELRTDDLRFTFDETATFLNRVMDLDISTKDVLALTARAEGWIAGLQMAALALQRTFSMHGREGVHNSIETFTGSHRYIMDYLTEQVLHHQPTHIQTFLLQTSILDHLTGPLCDAVCFGAVETSGSGQSDGQSTLEQLETANLFITALDDERCWYRYHHLFAELLRQQLSRTQPILVPTLHRRASEWYEENGLLLEAMRHALAAEDIERIARLVEENALAMIGHSELSIIMRWLDTLPGEIVRSRPWLCVLRAWALAYAAQVDAVELWLRDAKEALANVKRQAQDSILSQTEEQHLLGHIAAIRAYGVGWQGEMSRARELARQALELLPEEDLTAREFAALHLGQTSHWDGDLAGAARAYAEASAISQVAGHSHMAILAKCRLAELFVVQGQLHRAADACQEAQQLGKELTGRAGRQLPISGFVCIRKSKILRHRNQLEAATRQVIQGIELCDQWGQVEFTLVGYNELARILQERGDSDGALDACRKSMQIARGISFWPVAHADALEAWLRLAQGNVAAAARWAQRNGLDVEDDVTFQYEFLYLTLARLLIAQKKTDKALGLLARLLEMAEALGAMGSVIEILVLQALALRAHGETDQALAALERALTLAEPEGYVRVFVNEGVPMINLLRQTAARGGAHTYVCRLLAALEAERDRSSPIAQTLIEPLSEREKQVLRLITMGLSNREITESLCVSINTTKTHVKTIYGKLNVRNRVQAVGRARELRLM